MKIAIDIDSTLHDYWAQFAEAVRRRFGVTLPYEEQVTWEVTLLRPEQVRAAVIETHAEQHVLAAEPYPGAVEAVRGFQKKREIPVTGRVDQRTLDRLHGMTGEPTRDEMGLHNVPGPLDERCRTGRVLCIDKTSRTLRWVVDGHVLKTVDVRFGAAYTPTREGVFSVYMKSRDHVSRLYDTAMPFAMFFSGGQAVHYSPDFAATGYDGASHGCVNVRDLDAVAWLFDQVEVGDEVVVYWS